MASVILAGTTSTTALNLTGDTSGELQLKTNNGSTTAMTLTTGGNINIPTAGARITGDFSNATVANRVSFQNSTTNASSYPQIIPNGTGTASGLLFANSSTPDNSSFGLIAVNGTTDVRLTSGILGTGSYVPITMYTGGSERLRIDTSGNVGIGTSSPSQKLHVQGNSLVIPSAGWSSGQTANMYIGDTGNGWSSTFGSLNTLAGYYGFAFTTNGTERMRIDSSGNVQIGGTTSYGKITAYVGNNSQFAATTSSGAGGGAGGWQLPAYYGSVKMNYIDCELENGSSGSEASVMRFATIGSGTLAERMRITSGGNVLVNKTATNFTDSGLQLDNNSGNAGRVISTKSASGSYSVFVNYYAGTYVGGIDMSNTATGFPTSSDIRLKKNIVDCPNALDKVNQMRIVSHDWKVDDSHVEYGVIAQELEPIAPQAVKKGDDGETVEQTWAVDYSKLVPILTKAIQEQQAIITDLKQRIETLEAK